MALEIMFRAGRPRSTEEPLVERADMTRFRLHPGVDGRYLLPGVALRTGPPDHVVRVHRFEAEVQGVVGPLAQVLRTTWVPPDRVPDQVVGEAVLAEDVAVPMSVVAASLGPSAPVRLVPIRVLWKLEHLGSAGSTVSAPPVLVELEFVPLGVPRPPAVPGRAAPDEIEPVAHRGLGGRIGGCATIDLGTSSSTVTMCRSEPKGMPGMDPTQERVLGAGVADVLAGLSGEVEAAWRAVAARLHLPDDLSGRLRGRPSSGLVQSAVAAIELQCRDDPDSAVMLRPALHDCYRAAFRAPAMETFKLECHTFSTTGTATVDSTATVASEVQLPLLYLGDRPDYFTNDDPTVEPKVIRDLKRRFAQRRPTPEADISTERVVAAAYAFLADSAEREVAGTEGPDPLPRFQEIVATYPTTTTPESRRQLKLLLEESAGIPTVNTDYDEGVAAGLYFLFQDIGPDQATGAERFRAKSRAVDGNDRVREQTVVVIDIGGGTTDIAVIRYTMVDETESGALGRSYRIRPEIVGSTGHALLGGHYLTLHVFYWLKAAVVDAIVKQERDLDDFRREVVGFPRGGLVAALLAGERAGPELFDPTLRDLLRRLLPTRWADQPDSPAHQVGFDAFWRKAEEIKVALGRKDAKPVTLSSSEVAELLKAVHLEHRAVGAGAFGQLWDGGVPRLDASLVVQLQPSDLAELIRPAIDIAAAHAAGVVQKVITNGRAGGLDRILLSGQSSLMPLVAERVSEAMERIRLPEDSLRPRRIPEPEVERDYAKQAASIGACWARSNVLYGQRAGDNSSVRAGRTELMIRVDNLHTALPSDFQQYRFGRFEPLFRLGDRFRELDGTGRRGVRTPGFEAVPGTHEIWRVLGHQHIVPWSYFPADDLAEGTAAGGLRRPDPVIWGDDGTMQVMVELDQACAPTLHLCNNGVPHYVAAGTPVTFAGRSTLGALASVPPIRVRTGRNTGSDPERLAVFDAQRAAEPDGGFDMMVRPENDLDLDPVPGRILRSLPPVSRRTGHYVFEMVVDGVSRVSDPVPVPGDRDRAEYHALLLATGELRVFRGELPFLTADNLHELEDPKRAGAVLSRPVFGVTSEKNSAWDPYSGEH